MRLVSANISNFRSIKGKKSLEIGPATVLLGPNGAGKSNLLEAFRFLQQALDGQFTRTVEAFHHALQRDRPVRVELRIFLDSAEREQALDCVETVAPGHLEAWRASNFAREIRWEVSLFPNRRFSETLAISNFDDSWIFASSQPNKNSPSIAIGGIEQSLKALSAPAPIVTKIHNELPNGLERLLSWSTGDTFGATLQQMLRHYVSSWIYIPPYRTPAMRTEPAQEWQLKPDGSNLVKVMHSLQAENPEEYVENTRSYFQILPDVKRVTAPLRGGQATVVMRDTSGIDLELNDVSVGMLHALVITMAMKTLPRGTLIMIEEPELHLHAAAQRNLRNLIWQSASDRECQLLVTSHSTVFARVTDGTAVLLVTKEAGETDFRQLLQHSDFLTLTEALGHQPIDLLGYNGIIFVEGESEEVALPILARRHGIQLPLLGVRIFNIKGAGKSARMTAILEFLHSSSVNAYVILDGGSMTTKQVKAWVDSGLVLRENVTILPREFEDSFPNSVLVSAVRRIYPNTLLDEGKLSAARNQNKSVVHAIAKSVFESTEQSLDKPRLAEAIATIVCEEANTLTLPESALIKIAETCGWQPPA